MMMMIYTIVLKVYGAAWILQTDILYQSYEYLQSGAWGLRKFLKDQLSIFANQLPNFPKVTFILIIKFLST